MWFDVGVDVNGAEELEVIELSIGDSHSESVGDLMLDFSLVRHPFHIHLHRHYIPGRGHRGLLMFEFVDDFFGQVVVLRQQAQRRI